jgi:hypothetical protein
LSLLRLSPLSGALSAPDKRLFSKQWQAALHLKMTYLSRERLFQFGFPQYFLQILQTSRMTLGKNELANYRGSGATIPEQCEISQTAQIARFRADN